ncbi:MAG: hypothetical protein RIF41_33295, partial [Polyangiaceae bacterium]
LPEEGTGGTGGTVSGATSAGGAGGAVADGGAGGDASYPPPCDQWPCDACATCTVDFFGGDAAACEAYDACVANCMGSSTCEAGCQGSFPTGLFLRQSLENQCGDVCTGTPPCGG